MWGPRPPRWAYVLGIRLRVVQGAGLNSAGQSPLTAYPVGPSPLREDGQHRAQDSDENATHVSRIPF